MKHLFSKHWSVVCSCLFLTIGGNQTFAKSVAANGGLGILSTASDVTSFALPSDSNPGVYSPENNPGISSLENNVGAPSLENNPSVLSLENVLGVPSPDANPGVYSPENNPGISSLENNVGAPSLENNPSVPSLENNLGALSSDKKLTAGVRIKRLNGKKPLISMENFKEAGYVEADGKNINGPSVVKLPKWLPEEKRVDKRAKYYLYFAHHHGKYIRMAWSEKITGPYHLVGDSPLYGKHANAALALDKIPPVLGEVSTGNHVASPVVIVDDERHEFKLYYHAPAQYKNKGRRINQVTFFATSPDGLQFHKNIAPVYLGIFYFSPFKVNNRWYAFTNRGELCEAPEGGEIAVPKDFNAKKPLWKNWGRFFEKTIADYCKRNDIKEVIGVRHLSQVQKGNVLHVFFSSREDTPERLYHVCVDVSDEDCRNWKVGPMELVMSAEETWEGGQLTPKKSVDGYSPKPVNEIRDTFVYTENGRHYLFYCAGGERGIGVASLKLK